MAEILTRTYTYTGQENLTPAACSLPLSSFAVSGDRRSIRRILSIKIRHHRYHDTASSVGHAAQLIFADGTQNISTAKISKSGDKKYFWIENVFAAMPDAAAFIPENVTVRTYMSAKSWDVYWHATADYPITLTISYYGSEFEPSISDIRLCRANDMGAVSDGGTYLALQARLAVANAGKSGSGRLKLYAVGAADKRPSGGTLIYTSDEIPGSAQGTTISRAPIEGYTLAAGIAQYFKLVFEYAATAETGAVQSEAVESAAILIDRVFTNFHLAGVATGGACFGGYSSSSKDHPKLESHFPGYFYGGIANIQAGVVPSMGATAGGSVDEIAIQFPEPFAQETTPVVVIGFKSSSSAANFGKCSVAVVSASHLGFVFRFFNGDTSSRSPDYSYIAFGVPAQKNQVADA